MNRAKEEHLKSKRKFKIFRLFDCPTAEYTDIYWLVKDFLETSISDDDMSLVAVESADRFIDELISYDYMHQKNYLTWLWNYMIEHCQSHQVKVIFNQGRNFMI